MQPQLALASGISLGSTSAEELKSDNPEAKKKLSSPSARLKGVSTYNDSKAQEPMLSPVMIEVGLSVVLALALVLGVKKVLSRVLQR